MRDSKQHPGVSREVIAPGGALAEPEAEPIPPGARLMWDESAGKLAARLPKARWK